jgi:hypothetical protein
MKRIAAFLTMIFGSYAHADCQDFWLQYRSSTLHLSVEYSQACYHGELILNFSKFTKNGAQRPDSIEHLESIPFDRECQSKKKNKDGETVEFSCRKDGISPLAGATYRFKRFETTIRCDGVDLPAFDHTFICINGCGATTPKRLDVPYGEGCS